MQFRIDSASPEPPSRQLEEQVRFAVAAGRLRPGERLPSVRTLAADVRVNPNTVGRAWRELERAGVLEMRRGAGAFVAAAAVARCRADVEHAIAARLARAVRAALDAGIGPARIASLVDAALSTEDRRKEAS